jgi:isopenicillin N synthase-like dioxygenase
VRLGLQLFPLLALALGLPEDFFADKVRYGITFGRVIHMTAPTDNQTRRHNARLALPAAVWPSRR